MAERGLTHVISASGSEFQVKNSTQRGKRRRTSDSLRVFQMPRHLISDAHEMMNEIPTVPIDYTSEIPTGQGNGLCRISGKEDPVLSFTSSLTL